MDDSASRGPRLLSCGHTFCATCLAGLVDQDEATLKCPLSTCGNKVDVADVDALALPQHWAVLDSIHAAAPQVAPKMCHCKIEDQPHPAMLHCGRCNEDYCEAMIFGSPAPW
jgi:hypothetical protein